MSVPAADPPAAHVVLDVGRVLVQWDPELPYRRLLPDPQERAWFLSTVCTAEWIREQDRGRPWRDGEELLVRRFPEHEEPIRAFRRCWPEMVPDAVPGAVDLLRHLLDAGVDVTLLTNFAADTFVEARERFPFLDWPRGVTVSGEVGVVKPEREVYDLHVRTFGLDPGRTLLVDDTPANVEGARAAGWRAVAFVDGPTVRRDLAQHGLPA